MGKVEREEMKRRERLNERDATCEDDPVLSSFPFQPLLNSSNPILRCLHLSIHSSYV